MNKRKAKRVKQKESMQINIKEHESFQQVSLLITCIMGVHHIYLYNLLLMMMRNTNLNEQKYIKASLTKSYLQLISIWSNMSELNTNISHQA